MRFNKWLFLSAVSLILTAMLIGQVGDTRDIYDAFRDHKIDIEVHGDGIDHVNGRVSRKAGSKPMVVRIPPGTLFEANGGGVQNMVVTEGTTVDLTASSSAAFTAAVACSDIHLSVPGGDDRFTVAQLPPRKAEVVKFFPVSARAGASYEVKQAGVWIVTDDADYRGLGILVGGLFGGGSRVINEDEAANAMMLLERSGIDVTSRSIWNDRLSVCQSVITNTSYTSNANAWCGRVFRDTTDASWKLATLDEDSPAAVKRIARAALLQAKDDDSKATLINAVNTSQDNALPIVAQALGNFKGPEVGDALLSLLKDKSANVTAAAIGSLTRIKDLRAAEAVRPLVKASEPLQVRLAAVRCLGALGSSEDDSQALQEAAKDSSQQVRTAATLAIQQLKKRPRLVQ